MNPAPPVTSTRTLFLLTQAPLFLRVQGRGFYPTEVRVEPGSLKNVVIRDYAVRNATNASVISGVPTSPLGPMTLENITIDSIEGGTAEDAALPFNDGALDLYPSPRFVGKLPAYGFYFRDVQGPVGTANIRVSPSRTSIAARPTPLSGM